jgi:hypothetical protein
MAAVSSEDLTFQRPSAAEAVAIMRQRVLCSRSVITFAANVPKRDYLAVLLTILTSRVLPLRHVAAASVHQLSSSHAGAHALTMADSSRPLQVPDQSQSAQTARIR